MHTDQEAVLENSILWPISVPPRSTSRVTALAQTKEIYHLAEGGGSGPGDHERRGQTCPRQPL